MNMEEESAPLLKDEDIEEEELLQRAKELSLQDPSNLMQEKLEKQVPQQSN